MNLLINAADALELVQDRTKEIVVQTEVLSDAVRMSVRDTGSGIDPNTLSRVFEAFFTTKRRGTGLGLALCYSIITGHNGTIEIDSTVGEGTRVLVSLPLPIDEENS